MLLRSVYSRLLLCGVLATGFGIAGCSADEVPEHPVPNDATRPAANAGPRPNLPTIEEEMATVPEATPTGWAPYDAVYANLEEVHRRLTSGGSLDGLHEALNAEAKALAADTSPEHELTLDTRRNLVVEIDRYFEDAANMTPFDRVIRFEPVLMLMGEITMNTEPPAEKQLNRLEAMKNTLHRASEKYRPAPHDAHGETVVPPDVVPGVPPVLPSGP